MRERSLKTSESDNPKSKLYAFIRGMVHSFAQFMFLVAVLLSLYCLISCVISLLWSKGTDALIFLLMSRISIDIAIYTSKGD